MEISENISYIGYGQERGSLVTKLYNNYWQPLDIVFLENIPWYLPVYLHSVTITCGGKKIVPRKRDCSVQGFILLLPIILDHTFVYYSGAALPTREREEKSVLSGNGSTFTPAIDNQVLHRNGLLVS